MANGKRPVTTLEPDDASLADGTNTLQPGHAPGIDLTIHGDPSGQKGKGGFEQELVKRIRELKADARSKTDYTKLKQKIEKEGGTWRAPNGITFGLTKEGWVYQYLAEHEEGLAQTTIVALNAVPPFVAVIHTDLQAATPQKRRAILRELEIMVKRRKKPPLRKPEEPTVMPPQPPAPEIIAIVDKDWLSKISMARWGTIEWRRHLKPTEMTLAARAQKGVKFHEDLIYPGDTFEVISP